MGRVHFQAARAISSSVILLLPDLKAPLASMRSLTQEYLVSYTQRGAINDSGPLMLGKGCSGRFEQPLVMVVVRP